MVFYILQRVVTVAVVVAVVVVVVTAVLVAVVEVTGTAVVAATTITLLTCHNDQQYCSYLTFTTAG